MPQDRLISPFTWIIYVKLNLTLIHDFNFKELLFSFLFLTLVRIFLCRLIPGVTKLRSQNWRGDKTRYFQTKMSNNFIESALFSRWRISWWFSHACMTPCYSDFIFFFLYLLHMKFSFTNLKKNNNLPYDWIFK